MQVYLIDLESTGVDPLLEAGDRVYRVQVKASTYKTGEAYVFFVRRGKHKVAYDEKVVNGKPYR